MAVFTESETYHTSVFKLDVSTPVKGGPVTGPLTSPTDGEANAPLQAVVDRTAWLRAIAPPIGEIMAWPTEIAPQSNGNAIYLFCNGTPISRTDYSDLFTVLGTRHGEGDGSTTFNLPDYRGLFLRGRDNSAGVDPDAATRTAAATGGATGDAVGSVQDEAFKSHTHNIPSKNILGGPIDVVDPANTTTTPTTDIESEATGGSETRPVNAYVNYMIRAKYV